MRIRYTLGSLFPLALFAFWLVTLGPTQLGGPVAYVIVNGDSMEPTYEDGDLVIAKERSTYAVGDIVTFTNPDEFNSGMRVIHRITDIGPRGIITQVDNRDREDPWPLREGDILGVSIFHAPKVGTWLTTLRSSPLLLGLFAGAVAFILLLPSPSPSLQTKEDPDQAARGDEPSVASKRGSDQRGGT
jgi:signal peptidase I